MAINPAFPGSPLTVDSVALRKDIAGLVVRDSNGAPRAGMFPRNMTSIVTGRTDMTVNVAAFEGVSVRGGGALFLANDGTVVVPVSAAPSANARLDSVIFRQREDGYAGFSDGANAPIVEVVAGQASGTPQKPSLTGYPGAVELATILVTANATATNTLTITQTAQFTAASGGTVAVRDAAELTAWQPMPGSTAFHIGEGRTYERVGAAWRPHFRAQSVDYAIGVDSGAQVAAGASSSLCSISKTLPSGGWATVTASVAVPFLSGVNVAGSLSIRLGLTEIRRRRVHSHAKGFSSWSSPSVAADFLIPASASAQAISAWVSVDAGSGGSMEVWDAELKVAVY